MERVLDAVAQDRLARRGPDTTTLAYLALALIALVAAGSLLSHYPLTRRSALRQARAACLEYGDAADDMVAQAESASLAKKHSAAVAAAAAAVARAGLAPPTAARAAAGRRSHGQGRQSEGMYVREVRRALAAATRAAYGALVTAEEGGDVHDDLKKNAHAYQAGSDAITAATGGGAADVSVLPSFFLLSLIRPADHDDSVHDTAHGVLLNGTHILPPPPPASLLRTAPTGGAEAADATTEAVQQRWALAGAIASLSVAHHIFTCARARARAALDRLEEGERTLDRARDQWRGAVAELVRESAAEVAAAVGIKTAATSAPAAAAAGAADTRDGVRGLSTRARGRGRVSSDVHVGLHAGAAVKVPGSKRGLEKSSSTRHVE